MNQNNQCCKTCKYNSIGQECCIKIDCECHAPKNKEYKMICITCNKNFLPEGVFRGKCDECFNAPQNKPQLPNCLKCGKPLEEHLAIPGAPGGLECPQTKPQEQEEWEKELAILLQEISVKYDKWNYAMNLYHPIESFIRSLLRNQRAEATAELKERVIKYFEEVKNNKEEINLTKKIGIEMWHSSLGWNQAIEKAIEIVKKIK